jgi:hypothetical protein
VTKNLVSRILASILLVTANPALAKNTCISGFFGPKIEIVAAEGLKEYTKDAPDKNEVEKALEDTRSLPLPTIHGGLEFCLGKKQRWVARIDGSWISTKPFQKYLQGNEGVDASLETTKWTSLDGYLGMGWEAGASYKNLSLGLGYRPHQNLTVLLSPGITSLKASAKIDANEVDIDLLFPMWKENYSSEFEIKALRYNEHGFGPSINLQAIAQSATIQGERGNIELAFGGFYQKLFMQRDIGIIPENRNQAQRVYELTRTASQMAKKEKPKNPNLDFHNQGPLEMYGFSISMNARFGILAKRRQGAEPKIQSTYKNQANSTTYDTNTLALMDQIPAWK